ncbi:MAG TPA: transglycosylase SLT domain-containing protein [Polyangiaceae bacterium]|nr:transglycosylase SLT domain-containing protein [Polyangiaceae bacterium]
MDCKAVSATLATLLALTAPVFAAEPPTAAGAARNKSAGPAQSQAPAKEARPQAATAAKKSSPRASETPDAKSKRSGKEPTRAPAEDATAAAAVREGQQSAPKRKEEAQDGPAASREGEENEVAPSAAPPDSGIDPKRGQGERRVMDDGVGAVSPTEAASSGPPGKESRAGTAGTSKPGKGVSTEAGKGTRQGEPDPVRRRQVAQGTTDDELRAGKDDAELRSLQEAEWVLFPRPLPGIVPGWSWDLPRPNDTSLPEVISGAPASSRPSEPARATLPDAPWLRGLSMPNLPVRLEERVIRYLSFYRDSPSGRAIARAWAKKRGRFSGALRAELAKAGLPTDLVWLSLIESGHNATIVSPAGAAGLWQFMPDAGRAYGLVIDRWVDERLDPDRSTQAACRYLSDLYRRFGSWELAMAAYNMGYGGLSRVIRKYNTNDFWELARYEAGVPWETNLYVPKIIATAILMTNQRAFGVDDVEAEPAESFDTVLVGAGIPLAEVARIAAVPVATLEALNPQYLAGRTPPSAGKANRSWPVRVPAGRGRSVNEALAREAPADESLLTYVVRTGDTVESIAQTRGTTEALVRFLNGVDPKETLVAGTVLLVPQGERARDAPAEENLVVVPPRSFTYPDRRRVFYRVLPGDSLPRIADAFGLPRSDVLLWNALDESARLHPGMALQLFVPESQSLAGLRCLPESRARILIAGSNEFFEHFEGQNGKKRFVVRAKPDDSLTSIGKRYGMSVAGMERVNRRSRTDPIQAGEPVVVYTERARPLTGDVLIDTDPPVLEHQLRSDVPASSPAIAEVSSSGASDG